MTAVVLADVETIRTILRELLAEERAARSTAPEWLDSAQAAALLGVHVRTLAKLVRHEGLPMHPVSARTFRYRRDELEAWMDRRPAKGARRR